MLTTLKTGQYGFYLCNFYPYSEKFDIDLIEYHIICGFNRLEI